MGGDGGPNSWFLYAGVDSLYRINLETGKFEVVLFRGQFNDFALSPDDRLLAYSDHSTPSIIHIRNMDNGNKSQIEISENIIAAGAFLWSSDSTKLVFFVGYSKDKKESWQDDLSGTGIFVLNPKSMHLQKVMADDPRIFMPDNGCNSNASTDWLDENTICLYSTNDKLDSWNEFFSFNIQTGQIVFLRHF